MKNKILNFGSYKKLKNNPTPAPPSPPPFSRWCPNCVSPDGVPRWCGELRRSTDVTAANLQSGRPLIPAHQAASSLTIQSDFLRPLVVLKGKEELTMEAFLHQYLEES